MSLLLVRVTNNERHLIVRALHQLSRVEVIVRLQSRGKHIEHRIKHKGVVQLLRLSDKQDKTPDLRLHHARPKDARGKIGLLLKVAFR